MGDDKQEFVRAIYRQHCRSAGAIGSRAVYLAGVFMLAVLGSLALSRGEIFDRSQWPLAVMMMALSVFGLAFSVRNYVHFKAHTVAAEYILIRYGLNHYLPVYTRHTRGQGWMRLARLFPSLYLFCICFFLLILLWPRMDPKWAAAGIPILVLAVGLTALWVSRFDRVIPPKDG